METGILGGGKPDDDTNNFGRFALGGTVLS